MGQSSPANTPELPAEPPQKDCELCCAAEAIPPVWRSRYWHVRLHDHADHPLWFKLVLNRHATSLAECTAEEMEASQQLLLRLDAQIRAIMPPNQVNWCMFSNQVMHVHWHVIARYSYDCFFPDTPWSTPRRQLSDAHRTAFEIGAKDAASAVARWS